MSVSVCLSPLHNMPAVQLPSAQHPAEEEARVRPSDSLHSHRKNDAETHAEEKERRGQERFKLHMQSLSAAQETIYTWSAISCPG